MKRVFLLAGVLCASSSAMAGGPVDYGGDSQQSVSLNVIVMRALSEADSKAARQCSYLLSLPSVDFSGNVFVTKRGSLEGEAQTSIEDIATRQVICALAIGDLAGLASETIFSSPLQGMRKIQAAVTQLADERFHQFTTARVNRYRQNGLPLLVPQSSSLAIGASSVPKATLFQGQLRVGLDSYGQEYKVIGVRRDAEYEKITGSAGQEQSEAGIKLKSIDTSIQSDELASYKSNRKKETNTITQYWGRAVDGLVLRFDNGRISIEQGGAVVFDANTINGKKYAVNASAKQTLFIQN